MHSNRHSPIPDKRLPSTKKGQAIFHNSIDIALLLSVRNGTQSIIFRHDIGIIKSITEMISYQPQLSLGVRNCIGYQNQKNRAHLQHQTKCQRPGDTAYTNLVIRVTTSHECFLERLHVNLERNNEYFSQNDKKKEKEKEKENKKFESKRVRQKEEYEQKYRDSEARV